MSTPSIPPPLRPLLEQLELLSMVEPGYKINWGDRTFVDSTSWLGAYKRSTTGEGRKNLVVQINSIIDQTIDAIKEYLDTEFFTLIINGLARAKTGLLNLATTYQHRPDTVAQLHVSLANIQLQLDKYKHLITGRLVPPLALHPEAKLTRSTDNEVKGASVNMVSTIGLAHTGPPHPPQVTHPPNIPKPPDPRPTTDRKEVPTSSTASTASTAPTSTRRSEA